MQTLIHWFARNHVAANFVTMGVLLLGITTWFKLKKEIFPETATDIVTIVVPYPNASPEEVEKSICIPIEEAVQGVDGIDRLKSSALENRGLVIIETAPGYDTRNLMDDLKNQVDAIDSFPDNSEEPLLLTAYHDQVYGRQRTEDVLERQTADEISQQEKQDANTKESKTDDSEHQVLEAAAAAAEQSGAAPTIGEDGSKPSEPEQKGAPPPPPAVDSNYKSAKRAEEPKHARTE